METRLVLVHWVEDCLENKREENWRNMFWKIHTLGQKVQFCQKLVKALIWILTIWRYLNPNWVLPQSGHKWTGNGFTFSLTRPCLSEMLLVNFNLWKETTFCIHCSPVAGESGWMYIRFGISGSALPATIQRLERKEKKNVIYLVLLCLLHSQWYKITQKVS